MSSRHTSVGLVALTAVLLLLPTCRDPSADAASTVRDSAGITIVQNRAPRWREGEAWTVASEPSLDIGTMDGPPEYQLFRVAGATRLADGRIAVANAGTAEVRLYGRDGAFRGAMGGRGGGPGEFEGLFMLRRTRGDSLLAYDWRNRRISVLSPAGEFVRSLSLTFLSTAGGFLLTMDAFPNGDLLLATDMFLASDEPAPGARRDSAIYYVLTPDGRDLDTLAVHPGGESYQTMEGEAWLGGGLVFGKAGVAAVSRDGYYYGSADRWELAYHHRRDGLARLVRLDRANLPVRQADIDRYVADRMERARDEERRRIYRTLYETMPFPEIMPAYEDLVVDAEGNVWVEAYRRPGDDQPRWEVFDPRGAFLGTVLTPQRFRIFEIGSDYLLGRWADTMDVEHVRMYELRKGRRGSVGAVTRDPLP